MRSPIRKRKRARKLAGDPAADTSPGGVLSALLLEGDEAGEGLALEGDMATGVLLLEGDMV